MAIKLCSQVIYVYKVLFTTQIPLKQLHSNKQENNKISDTDFKYEWNPVITVVIPLKSFQHLFSSVINYETLKVQFSHKQFYRRPVLGVMHYK